MTPKNNRAHCIPLPPVMLAPIKKPKGGSNSGDRRRATDRCSTRDRSNPGSANQRQRAKRNKSAAQQIVEPQPTAAPDEVAAPLAP